MSLFLFDTHLLTLTPDTHPLRSQSFPLAPEVYDQLTADTLVGMLCDDLNEDPANVMSRPGYLLAFAHMLSDKAGANVFRLVQGGGGLSARWAQVPEMSLRALEPLAKDGMLSPEVVEESIWTPLQNE